MKRILFSPLGLTDPISNFRDGAMLNICRFNDIDKVYMYMSKEIYEYHCHDNRYLYCLDKLGEMLGKKFEYELIVRENLVDVHLFDIFIKEFRAVIEDIHIKNPDDEIYVNVSSGTPGMKSALQIIAAFREYNIIPIQVATPEKKSNPHLEEKLDYKPEEMWSCNDDNTDPQNRCHISENINFLMEMKSQMLSELINKYDYTGALALAETMSNSFNDEFMDILKAAVCRYSLDYNSANNCFKKYGYSVLEAEESNKAAMAEYLLYLDVKVKRNEIGDFIRGITPILAAMFERILKRQLNIKIEDYTYLDKKKVRRWSKDKLEKRSDIMQLFNDSYNGGFKESFVNSDSLVTIIEGLSQDNGLINLCVELREIEIKIRNSAAHTMVSVTDEVIKNKTGESSGSILYKLFKATRYTDLNLKENFFESYDKMNNILIETMKKPIS